MRVLYVDDDRVNALLFTETCRVAGGIEVETASSRAEALEIAPGFAPELLVIDLHLSDGDGLSLLPELRAALGRAVPAALCTADEGPAVENPARAAGFERCWTKPVRIDQLLAELALLRDASGTPSPGRP